MIRTKRNIVKESFDNLPAGICFFDKNGIVRLCNYQMQRIVYTLTGRDLQCLTDLIGITESAAARNGGSAAVSANGTVYSFTQENIALPDGSEYTQVAASDVTRLYDYQKELERDNAALKEDGKRLRALSENVVAVTREEEILAMKMRVHDDIGRCVIAARRVLADNRLTGEIDIAAWKNVIGLLKNYRDSEEKDDALTQLREAAAGIGVRIIIEGSLPENSADAYPFICAMRECATNAVRHAGAFELYVRIASINGFASATIRNNGDPPRGRITEGGGLSSLRTRIERAGGTMSIRCTPEFELTVTVQLGKENAK